MCNDRRRDNLRMVELLSAWVPMCANCSLRATRLSPMPRTVDEVRSRLLRDRRREDRRAGRSDGRVFPRERRAGLERRAVGAARGEDLMLLDDDDIVILEPGAPEEGDETRIVTRT
jgi:hypothetical protein